MTSKKRKLLQREAHHLRPTVMVGKNGVTPSVTEALKEHLAHHELVKIKFIDYKDEKQELMDYLCRETEAEQVNILGNIGIAFKRQEDPEKQKYPGIPES